jgi:hypothetical protein
LKAVALLVFFLSFYGWAFIEKPFVPTKLVEMINVARVAVRRLSRTLTYINLQNRGAFFPAGTSPDAGETLRGGDSGSSRPIVRATLEKLRHEGLLEDRAGGGYAPRVFTEQDIADAIEARGALESLAAGRAARRVPETAQIDAARRINAELAEMMGSIGSTVIAECQADGTLRRIESGVSMRLGYLIPAVVSAGTPSGTQRLN